MKRQGIYESVGKMIWGGPTEKLFTAQEVAQILRVSERTVMRWIESGQLLASQPGGPAGHYRISESAIKAMLEPARGDQ